MMVPFGSGVVPDGSGGGNANPPPRRPTTAKNWICRWSNYSSDWKDILVPVLLDKSIGYIIGEEICPTTGTPHLQGYTEFEDKIRPFPGLGLPLQIKWIAAKGGLERNKEYCSKEGNYISWGTCKIVPKFQINITLYPWEMDICTILDAVPDDRSIYWFWEAQGCTGKTTFQKWVFLNYPNVVIISGKASDMKNGILTYYEEQKIFPKIVLINIPRCQDTDHVSWQGIEEIKDMFFYAPKYQGGMVCGPNPHVMIFSNKAPPDGKLSEDRWKITEISILNPPGAPAGGF